MDIEPQITKYAALNMMMNGDGLSNIQNADSLEHFGYLAEWPQIYKLINKFLAKYNELKQRLGRSHTEIFRELDDILPMLQELSNLSGMNATLDLRSKAFQTLYRLLEILTDRDLLGDTAHKFKEWDEICRNKGMQPIRDLMIHVWSAANADIQNGFDVITENGIYLKEGQYHGTGDDNKNTPSLDKGIAPGGADPQTDYSPGYLPVQGRACNSAIS